MAQPKLPKRINRLTHAKPRPAVLPKVVLDAPQSAPTRERILHAAVEILNAEGFGALTQTRVAEKAGVRQSHVTYYFPVRNDLLRETAVYGCSAMLEMFSAGIAAGTVTLATARSFFVADISDRRFARLMCALIVASDEDDRIKPWVSSFEQIHRERLLDVFQRLGLKITIEDIEFFHSAFVGAVMLDLSESTESSLSRSSRVMQHAFDHLLTQGATANVKAKPGAAPSHPKAKKKSRL